MGSLLPALAVIGMIILLYILLSRQKKDSLEKSAKANAPKENFAGRLEPIKHGNSALSGFASEMKKNPEPDTAIPDELGISDIHGNLRKFLHSGIDAIFAPAADSPEGATLPLTKKDISPETMMSVSNHIDNLKNLRSEHFKLQKIINNPAGQMSELSRIILADPILTAKILRMANSPYFGMQSKIDSISHALMILGLQNIKNILYREGMLQLFQTVSGQHQETVAYLWKHASLTSVCASGLHDLFDGLNKGTLFTLGILHDIGKLIVLGLPKIQAQGPEFRERYPEAISILDEDMLLGINHAVIGRIVLEQWNFSELMTNSTGLHHIPSFRNADSECFSGEVRNYVIVLFIADQIAKLFAGRYSGVIRVNSLRTSYHALIDKNKLIAKVMDSAFLAQIREAEAIAVSEYKGMAAEVPAGSTGSQNQTVAFEDHAISPKVAYPMEDTVITKRPGQTIGRYKIIKELGRGAMGTVFLGRDPLINRDVAIKTLRYDNNNEEEALTAKNRFFQEAEAIGKLTHPNIVTIYDVGEYACTAYMAMELLDGSDLTPYCKQKNLLPFSETIRIVSSVAETLAYAHDNGVVHRDIKPGNIWIMKNGNVKVVDFGIARIIDTSSTHTGVVIGSPSYMSPEQVQGQKVDGRSDLFSLGVVFYELLTGEKPFQGDNLTSLMLQITTAQPAPVQELAPHTPYACVSILEKALTKNRENRYQNGREMIHDLSECLTGL